MRQVSEGGVAQLVEAHPLVFLLLLLRQRLPCLVPRHTVVPKGPYMVYHARTTPRTRSEWQQSRGCGEGVCGVPDGAFTGAYLFVLLVSLLGDVFSLCQLCLQDAYTVVLHIGTVFQALPGTERGHGVTGHSRSQGGVTRTHIPAERQVIPPC